MSKRRALNRREEAVLRGYLLNIGRPENQDHENPDVEKTGFRFLDKWNCSKVAVELSPVIPGINGTHVSGYINDCWGNILFASQERNKSKEGKDVEVRMDRLVSLVDHIVNYLTKTDTNYPPFKEE